MTSDLIINPADPKIEILHTKVINANGLEKFKGVSDIPLLRISVAKCLDSDTVTNQKFALVASVIPEVHNTLTNYTVHYMAHSSSNGQKSLTFTEKSSSKAIIYLDNVKDANSEVILESVVLIPTAHGTNLLGYIQGKSITRIST